MAARSLARFIILARSRANAFLLSLSSSGGIALKTPSIAMSFASAKLLFNSFNSFSILSNAWLDNSFSESVNKRHYRRCALKMLRRSSRPAVVALNCLPSSNAGGSSSRAAYKQPFFWSRGAVLLSQPRCSVMLPGYAGLGVCCSVGTHTHPREVASRE